MQIKDPKFKEGQKVRDIEDGTIFTLININSYGFGYDEYWYELECDGLTLTRPESKLETYIDKPKTVWDLKEGDECFFITSAGNILAGNILDWYWDEKSVEIGNCFLTKEEAEFEIERRKIETEMIRLGGRRKFNRGKDNYFIMYTRIEGLDYVNYQSMHEQGVIYFDSELDAINAVKTIGKDKIKKYIFVES